MRLLFVVFLILGAAFVAAIRLLPWWGLLALFGWLVFSVVALVKWGLPRLLRVPFRAKGAVLRGATVHVHLVERAEAPEADGVDGDGAGPREHYRIEVTITPRAPSGSFKLWEPRELVLVGPNARAGDPEADDSAGEIGRIEVEDEGRFAADEGMKYGGPQRLRLLVSTPAGQRRVRFRYYFELLGDVTLPATSATSPASPIARAR